MRKLSKLFAALSDSNRLRILKILELKPMCVCEITEVLKLAPSTVSKHLSLLRDSDLIQDEKDGKWVQYRLASAIKDKAEAAALKIVRNSLSDDRQVLADIKCASKISRKEICGGKD